MLLLGSATLPVSSAVLSLRMMVSVFCSMISGLLLCALETKVHSVHKSIIAIERIVVCNVVLNSVTRV